MKKLQLITLVALAFGLVNQSAMALGRATDPSEVPEGSFQCEVSNRIAKHQGQVARLGEEDKRHDDGEKTGTVRSGL